MPEGNSLINLGDLSKPATVLIEKISNAVGVLYEPRRIRKKAEGEVEAEKIKALASIELNDIQQRAIDRLVHQETRKQKNIEDITEQAVSTLNENAKAEDIEEDWIAHFFNNCESVSDKEMQSLWSSLLSGETNSPGTFSKRTVDFVASMDKKDAQLFTDFCQFVFSIGDTLPLIFNPDHEIYNSKGIDFSTLKHLDAIGLVSFEPTAGYLRTGFEKTVHIIYFDNVLQIDFKTENNNKLKVGKILLTKAGEELYSICNADKNDEFYEYVIGEIQKQGCTVNAVT